MFTSGHKQFLSVGLLPKLVGGGKKVAGPFLPHPKNQLKAKNFYFGIIFFFLGGGGEEMGRPVSSPPSKPSESKILTVLCYQLYLVLISKIELISHFLPHLTTKHFSGLTNYWVFFFWGGGKKWAGLFLPHPQNQVKAKYSQFWVISYI